MRRRCLVDEPPSDIPEGHVLGGKTMMSWGNLPKHRGMAKDVVIHSYTFMARTPRAVSIITDSIKMSCNYYGESFS